MDNQDTIDTLVILSLSSTQLYPLTELLIQNGFFFTRIETAGWFLEKNVGLLIGIDHPRLPSLLDIIRDCCRQKLRFVPISTPESMVFQSSTSVIEAQEGGAKIFVLPVERFIKI